MEEKWELNTVAFIDRLQKIKKGGTVMLYLFAGFAGLILWATTFPEYKKDPSGLYWGAAICLLFAIFGLLQSRLSAQALDGDEDAAKKMIYLLELDRRSSNLLNTIIGFIILMFILHKVMQAFEEDKRAKEGLKKFLDEVKK